jgi:hypothetical protein
VYSFHPLALVSSRCSGRMSPRTWASADTTTIRLGADFFSRSIQQFGSGEKRNP